MLAGGCCDTSTAKAPYVRTPVEIAYKGVVLCWRLATPSRINTARCGFKFKTCFEMCMKQQGIKSMAKKTSEQTRLDGKTMAAILDESQGYRINPQCFTPFWSMSGWSRTNTVGFPPPSSKPSWQGHIEMIGLRKNRSQHQGIAFSIRLSEERCI